MKNIDVREKEDSSRRMHGKLAWRRGDKTPSPERLPTGWLG
jgi:hypothetical protein